MLAEAAFLLSLNSCLEMGNCLWGSGPNVLHQKSKKEEKRRKLNPKQEERTNGLMAKTSRNNNHTPRSRGRWEKHPTEAQAQQKAPSQQPLSCESSERKVFTKDWESLK
jgi:hypothetical protein